MADISKIKTLNGTTYDIKDAKARMLGIYYVEGPSTDKTAGTWTGVIDGLTQYYDGLSIIYVPAIKGASTTTLNINGLGAKTCYYTGTSKLTTHYGVGTPILLTYHNNAWRRADYNSNTTYSNATSEMLIAGTDTSLKTIRCDEFKNGILGIIVQEDGVVKVYDNIIGVGIDQGTENAGKVMTVNQSGTIEPQTLQNATTSTAGLMSAADKQKLDEWDGGANLADGLAIVTNGNTHAAIAKDQFVYVRNHSSLAEGLYKASAEISMNGALSTSNLTANTSGGLNALKEDISSLDSAIQDNHTVSKTGFANGSVLIKNPKTRLVSGMLIVPSTTYTKGWKNNVGTVADPPFSQWQGIVYDGGGQGGVFGFGSIDTSGNVNIYAFTAGTYVATLVITYYAFNGE